MEEILTSIKKLLGMGEDYTAYDNDIIIHINSVFSDLKSMGVGPADGFKIKGRYEIWSDFTGDDNDFESVKTYMYMRVRLIFDPPSSSAVIDAYKEEIAKFEWRLNVAAETPM